MAAPNIVSPTTIVLKPLFVANLGTATGTAATTLLSCGATSNTAIKLSSLVVANNDTANAVSVSVRFFTDTATTNAVSIVNSVIVPAAASLLCVSRDNPVYLEEGDIIRGTAGTAAKLDVTGSYEVIS